MGIIVDDHLHSFLYTLSFRRPLLVYCRGPGRLHRIPYCPDVHTVNLHLFTSEVQGAKPPGRTIGIGTSAAQVNLRGPIKGCDECPGMDVEPSGSVIMGSLASKSNISYRYLILDQTFSGVASK